jgi:hypothetical protein
MTVMKSLDEYIREEDAKRVAEQNTPEARAAFDAMMDRNREKAARELAAVPVLTPTEAGREAYLRGDDDTDYPDTYSGSAIHDFVTGWHNAQREHDDD